MSSSDTQFSDDDVPATPRQKLGPLQSQSLPQCQRQHQKDSQSHRQRLNAAQGHKNAQHPHSKIQTQVNEQKVSQNVAHCVQTRNISMQEQHFCQSLGQIPIQEQLKRQNLHQCERQSIGMSRRQNRPSQNTTEANEQNQNLSVVQTQIQPIVQRQKHPRRQRKARNPPQRPVEFTLTDAKPVLLDARFRKHGCYFMDAIFTKPSKVGELRFRNHYTATVTVFVREYSQAHADEAKWIKSIPHKVLMPCPIYANGGEDLISITTKDSESDWSALTAVRLILRQPSPTWRKFFVKELSIFTELPAPTVSRLYTYPDGRTMDAFLALMRLQTDEALDSGRYAFNTLAAR